MSDYFAVLRRWQELKAMISTIQEEERSLREGLFAGAFPNPQEGVNTYELPDGSKLKGTYKINRDLTDGIQFLPEPIRSRIVRLKPELNLKEYRTLSGEELQMVDKVIVAKPGLPSLELVPPKEPKQP